MAKKVLNKKVDLKKKIDLNKKIDLEIDENAHGWFYGLLIGSVVGIILTLIFRVDLGFAYGIGPGMVIGLLFDINASNEKRKRKNLKRKNKNGGK